MITPKQTARLSSEFVHDRRTELVRDMVAKENAATDAKTAKLRALRLAKEAEDKAAGKPAPSKPKPKPKARP